MTETWVAVADGRKAVLFKNSGSRFKPDLHVLRVDEIENPATREQGADRAGRMNDGRAGSVRKSAFAATDYHQLEEDRFAARFAAGLDRAARDGAFAHLAVVAPPTALGALRAAFSPLVKSRISIEIDRDFVNHPVAEIERLLADAFDRQAR